MSRPSSREAPVLLRVDARVPVDPIDSRFINIAVFERPRLSWRLPLRRMSKRQDAFEVELWEESASEKIWTSGIVQSPETAFVLPISLQPLAAFRWRVRIVSDAANWSSWSEFCELETGPLRPSDWEASWVTVPDTGVGKLVWEQTMPAAKGRLYLTAQGLVRATLNDAEINAGSADPSRTSSSRALYRTFDITHCLRPGRNVLELETARAHWAVTGRQARVLASVRTGNGIQLEAVAGTAPGMPVWPSEVTHEERFYLERHDPVAVRNRAPSRAELASDPPSQVAPDPGPAVRALRRIEPVSVQDLGEGNWVFDFGTNIAGRTKLQFLEPLPVGTIVRLVHGEQLNAEGHVDTTNISMPNDTGRKRQVLELVAAGAPGETLEPWFAYYGFRYVELEGVAEAAAVELQAFDFHSDLAQVATLECSSDLVTQLDGVASRTLLNNAHGLPEDCPTREQAGWGGDAAIAADFAASKFDMQAFYNKWIDDLTSAQRSDGEIPAVAPDLDAEGFPGEPIYSAALHRVLTTHWLHYGDKRRIIAALPALERWADYQLRHVGGDGLVSAFPMSYGQDWLGLEQTPTAVHHTAAVISCLEALAFLEQEMGTDDPERRLAQARALRLAGRRFFFDAARGTFANGSQGANAAGLQSGMIPASHAALTVDHIIENIRAHGNRVTSGYATTRDVVWALSSHGRSDVLIDVLRQGEEPGVGAMLRHGLGTLWETWWRDPLNAGTGSLDHIGLAAPFAGWIYQVLVGVAPVEQGFRRFRFQPFLTHEIPNLKFKSETARGEISVRMSSRGERRRIELTVPTGTEAHVSLPGIEAEHVGPGHHSFEVEEPESSPRLEPTTFAWSPPPRSAQAADIVHLPGRLDEALATATFIPGEDTRLTQTDAALLCRPIPHAQMPGNVTQLTSRTGAVTGPAVLLRFGHPISLEGVSFIYAFIDLCIPNPHGTWMPYIALHGADGHVRRREMKPRPASWNRLTIDLDALAARDEAVGIEVGLALEDGVPAGLTFHLGEIGFSHAKRTW